MKKAFCRIFSCILATMCLTSQSLILAHDEEYEYIPFSVQNGGTGATTVEQAKINLEIPNVVQETGQSTTDVMSQKAVTDAVDAVPQTTVVQTTGQSETVVMSQKAITDALEACSGDGVVVTQTTGQSTVYVMSQKAVTDALDAVPQNPIVQTTGQSTTDVMSQKAVTDALDAVPQTPIVQTTCQSTTNVMSQKAVTDALDNVSQSTIVQTTCQSTTTVMSQKAVTDALITLQTIFNAIYPVGSIYMSVRDINPSTLFGGSWSLWGAGRVPVCVNTGDTDFNTSEKTGGAKTVTLSTSQMPSHTHTQNAHKHDYGRPALFGGEDADDGSFFTPRWSGRTSNQY